ncbi:MAG: hypothetical protein ABI594_14465 [Ginsengibacter sp.]
MKKVLFISLVSLLIFSCHQPSQNEHSLQMQIESLKTKLADTYKPGFGEFMTSIQAHHAKLWFAGQNQNWQLCDFEIHEIMENIEGIKLYETERKESKLIDMIDPAIDSINQAIQKKDPTFFKSSYVLLTNTCNNCHKAVQFEFNVVKIPDTQSFSNQDFSPVKSN